MDGEARPLSAAALRASRGVALRAECGNDEAFVFTLFVEARAPGFANIPLEPAQRDALLRQQFTLQTTQYRRSFPAASFSIVEWGAASIGRLYVDRSAPSMHVIDVALLRAWQGRGIGSRLLGELLEEARVAGHALGAGWSASATPGVTWSNPSSTPIEDVETAANTIATAIGNEANTGVMGRGLWRYVKQHPDVVDRIKYSAGPNSPAVVTLMAVAALFGLEKLLVGTAVQDSGVEGGTSSQGYVWGNHLLVAHVTPRASLLRPSAGYLLNYKTRRVERFREEQEHQYVITTSQSWDVIQPATDAGYLIKSAA